jgi:uncharacterized membrane protein
MRSRYFLPLACVILLVGFALRTWDLGVSSLWVDEVTTDLRARAPFGEALESILKSGNQTPLYFLSLRAFPHHSEALLRYPSVLLGVLGIALIMFVATQLYADRRLALAVGALLAVNPYHVWLSRTARPYALIFVLSLLVSYYFLMLLKGHRTRGMWVGFVISSMAAYMTHYFTFALPLAQWILFMVTGKEDRAFFRRWFKSQVIAGTPLVIWSMMLLTQLHIVTVESEWIPRPVLRDIPLTFWNMLVGYEGLAQWYVLPALLLAVTGLVIGVVRAVRGTEKIHLYWLWVIVAPLAGVFVISALLVSLYVDRYFMIFLPGLLFLMLYGLKMIPRPLGVAALVVMVLTGTGSVLDMLESGDYQREDWRAVAAYIQQYRQPQDQVMIENPGLQRAFERYAAPDTPVEIVRRLVQRGLDEGRVWAIYRNPNEDVHRLGVMPDFDPFAPSRYDITQWVIENRSQIVQQREFNGIKVFLLDLDHNF